MVTNFINTFETSIKNNWTSVAIVDRNIGSVTYSELAEQIIRLHLLWQIQGLKKGNKIAVIANNSARWIEVFMATMSGGYTAIVLSPNLAKKDMQDLLIHSDTRVVYFDGPIDSFPDPINIPLLDIVFDINTNQVLYSRDSSRVLKYNFESFFENEYKNGINKNSVHFNTVETNDIDSIVYTSGTIGVPKGAMQQVSFSSLNIQKLLNRYHYNKGDFAVCVCPFFHVLGITADVLTSLCTGMTIVIPPSISPQDLIICFQEYKPKNIFMVPLLLQKIVESVLKKDISIDMLAEASNLLCLDAEMCNFLYNKLILLFGGELETLTTGGTSLPEWLEKFLVDKLRFPLITLYGLTECGGLSMGMVGKYKAGSCGTIVSENQIRIQALNSKSLVGEVQVKTNIFAGYYKAPNLTKASFTDDGWFKTGDLGYIDDGGNLFITGRCKDMLLTSNGENIYPEDIETAMDVSTYIKESILTQRGDKLHAIVVPDREKALADGLDAEALEKKIDEVVREASKKLPGFTIISGFELRDEPLERTPKGSLKRYLYSDGIKEN